MKRLILECLAASIFVLEQVEDVVESGEIPWLDPWALWKRLDEEATW